MNYFNYFSDIEEAFVRRRGKQILLSPLDWALMDVWQNRGIPVHVALKAIDEVFDVYDKRPGVKRGISSLSYCKREVEAAFEEWSAGQVGQSETGDESQESGAGFTVDGVREYIEGVIRQLGGLNRREIEDELRDAVGRLKVLCGSLTNDFEAIDAKLGEIEKDLEFAMLTKWTRAEVDIIERELATQMAEYKSTMDPDAYDRTYTLMLLNRLRETSGIPRLSLFSL